MNSDFRNYAYARIEKALTGNEEYVGMQKKCVEMLENNDIEKYEHIANATEVKATELSYMQGFNDAMQLIMKGAGSYE